MHDYPSFVSSYGKTTQNEPPVELEKDFKPIYGSTQMGGEMASMDTKKLQGVLRKFREYPEKYRTMIWRYLLDLPMNKMMFESYVKRDPHPAYANLYKTYNVKSYRLYNKLVRILSGLAYWSPLFAEINYLPDLVFPFVKIIKSNDLVLFEVIMSFLMQFCQLWFEKFPCDPVHLLKTSVEVIIAKESIVLYKHFVKQGFGVAQYAWPMIKNAFSIVLPKDDWLKLIDHLLTYKEKPELLLFFTSAYLLHFKGTLTKIQSIEEMCDFVESQNPVNMNIVLKETFSLHKKYNGDEEVYYGTMSNYLPLQSSTAYPVFFNYPKESVENASRIRSLKLSEQAITDQKEKEISELRQRVSRVLLRDKQERLQAEAIAQSEIQKSLLEKQNLERQILQKLHLQDERAEYLRQLEKSLQISVSNQEALRSQDKQRITQEYEERRRLAEYEHRARLQEEEMKSLEHKATQRLLEMISIREKEDYQRQLNIEASYKLKEEEERDKMLMEKWRLEDEERKLRADLEVRERQRLRELQVFEYDRQRVDMQHRVHQLEKEVYVTQLERERRLRQAEEDYMFAAERMREEIGKKNEMIEALEKDVVQEIRDRGQWRGGKTDEKIQEIYRQKREIEEAMEFERMEQMRLQKIIEKKRFEQQMMDIKLTEEDRRVSDEEQLELLERKMEKSKKEWNMMNTELYNKEKEIMEKEKFQELLHDTDENLRKIEEEKLIQEHMRVKDQMMMELNKARESRESQMRDIIRERELNFQEYTIQRQNQIREEYMKSQEMKSTNKHEKEQKIKEANSFIEYKHTNDMLSPDRSPMSNARTELNSPGDENISPNYNQMGANSEVSYSINQKYLNKDVYNVSKSQSKGITLKDQILANKAALTQSYPLSENIERNDEEMSSTITDDESQDSEIIRKHEQAKQAFESYKKSWGNCTNSQTFGEGCLPVKDSTFGMGSSASQDFNKYAMVYSANNRSMNDTSDRQEMKSQNQIRSRMSNMSSPITEEDEGESDLSYVDQNDVTVSSGSSVNTKMYQNQQMMQGYSNDYKDQSYGGLDYISDVSSSKNSNVGVSGYYNQRQIEEMSINPFYKPNPTFSDSVQWKKA